MRIGLVAILIIIIFAETKYAMELLPIPTVIRCCLEVINLLNLLPFVIYDDPDFDNIAELYSSRELSMAIGRKRKNEINKEINAIYANYSRNLQLKQQQMMANNPMNHSMTPPQQRVVPMNQNANGHGTGTGNGNESRRSTFGPNNMIRLMMPGTSHSFEITPAPIPSQSRRTQQEVLLQEDSSVSVTDSGIDAEDDHRDDNDDEDDGIPINNLQAEQLEVEQSAVSALSV